MMSESTEWKLPKTILNVLQIQKTIGHNNQSKHLTKAGFFSHEGAYCSKFSPSLNILNLKDNTKQCYSGLWTKKLFCVITDTL